MKNNGEKGSEIFKPVERFLEGTEKMSWYNFQEEIGDNKSNRKILITPKDLILYVVQEDLVKFGLLPRQQKTTGPEPGAPQPTPLHETR